MSRTAAGLRAWLVQRVTAVYLAGFTLYLLARLSLAPPGDWHAWRAMFGSTPMAVAVLLAVLALLAHAWVGLRDVLIDYVHPLWLRLSLLALIAAGLIACGLWAARILLAGGPA